MLPVQEYLMKGKSLEDLTREFAIKVKHHETLPLVILNYNQIESIKLHPITLCCRGLILEKETWRVVAKGFTRFFNFGEALEVTDKFDWENPIECYTKEDGSYINVFWYGDRTAPRTQWRMSTRGSFGTDELLGTNQRWLDLVHSLIPDEFYSGANKEINYVFELVSPYNKVVRRYSNPTLILLSATTIGRDGNPMEIPSQFLDLIALSYNFARPACYKVAKYEHVESLLRLKEKQDPTFEGFVLKDVNGLRLKVKTTTYMALHRLRGEGDNMYSAKNLVPLILANEGDEILTYFPEVADTFKEQKAKVQEAYTQFADVWWMSQDKKYREQKAFAIYITKTNPTPFSSILFRMKQDGTLDSESALKEHWLKSGDLILKHVFGR